MPELPDVTVNVEALERHVGGRRLPERIRTMNPFVLRSFDPPLEAAAGRIVRGVRRIGKRIVLDLGDDLFVVIHLMIAGRFVWKGPEAKSKKPAPNTIAAFEFENGTLYFTEAGTKKRASLTLVQGEAALKALDPGGIEPLGASFEEFAAALARESHTLKRSLTDPHLFSGIGNAYSDEILHAAKLSPMKLTRTLDDRRGAPSLRRHAQRDTHELDGPASHRGRRRISRKGHGLPSDDGRAWTVQAALPRLRRASATHRLRQENRYASYLRALPDGREASRGSLALAAAEGRLAEVHRRSLISDANPPTGHLVRSVTVAAPGMS